MVAEVMKWVENSANFFMQDGTLGLFLDRYLGVFTVVLALIVIIGYLVISFNNGNNVIKRLTVDFKDKLQRLIDEKLSPLGEFGNYLVAGIVLASLSILLFAKLAEDLIYQELMVFDSVITKFITGFNTPLMTQVMKLITVLGSAIIMIPLALLVIYILYQRKKHFWDSIMVIVNLGGGWLLNALLKWVFHRPRPDVARLVEVSGYSFPSGHSMVSTVFYGFLAYLLWLNLRHAKFRYWAVFSLVILILMIGISRIYLGAHYPSDVLAGFAAGGFWLTSCILALQAVRYYKANSR